MSCRARFYVFFVCVCIRVFWCLCRGSNALLENQSPGVSKRVLLSQFPIGDQSTFRHTWAEVLAFLMAPEEGLTHPFWECMSAEQALDVVVNATYLAAPPAKPEEEQEEDKGEKEVEKEEKVQTQGLTSEGHKGREGDEKEGEKDEETGEEEEEEVAANKASKEARAYAHTTGYRLGADEKAALLQRLRGDPVLGPVIEAVAAALNATPDPTTANEQGQG